VRASLGHQNPSHGQDAHVTIKHNDVLKHPQDDNFSLITGAAQLVRTGAPDAGAGATAFEVY
jgi:hypothetical protein